MFISYPIPTATFAQFGRPAHRRRLHGRRILALLADAAIAGVCGASYGFACGTSRCPSRLPAPV